MGSPGTDHRIAQGMSAQLGEWRRQISSGAHRLGWKVGFATPAAFELLGTTQPLIGFLLDNARLEPGAQVSLGGWTRPVLEPEIAVHLEKSLDANPTREETMSAIAGMSAAIELVDVEFASSDPERILAANIFQRHVMVTPGRLDIRGEGHVTARVTLNGQEVCATRHIEALPREVAETVAHVATILREHGERLSAGDMVITGSVIPPFDVAPGDRVIVDMPPLGSLMASFHV
jgi:2-keto-4-pentenoate hydratase